MTTNSPMHFPSSAFTGFAALLALGACAAPDGQTAQTSARSSAPVPSPPPTGHHAGDSGIVVTIGDTTWIARFDAAGVASPFEEATVSTTLMGTVTDVFVHEGDRVRAGQTMLRLDARELSARAQRLAASVADADAMYRDAETQARRFAALYADSAATRAQHEAAQTGLTRAEAGLRAARAASAELEAAAHYATLRAPFDGIVVRRDVDRGSFAAPGVPLLTVQNVTVLRVSAAAPLDIARRLRRHQTVDVTLDGTVATATIEGVVPSGSSNLFTVNALVRNAGGRHAAGSSATLHLPMDTTHGILLPAIALVHEGDLVGVIVDRDGRRERRWIRLGTTMGDRVEVTSGLRAGDRVVLPGSVPRTAAATGATGA